MSGEHPEAPLSFSRTVRGVERTKLPAGAGEVFDGRPEAANKGRVDFADGCGAICTD